MAALTAQAESCQGREMEDPPQPVQSPQEKKKLSYAKDRRNSYYENSKASRKAIPRRKSIENRENRRKVAKTLAEIPRLDEAAADRDESSVRHDINRVGGWRKTPDIPLADHIRLQRKRRLRREPEGS